MNTKQQPPLPTLQPGDSHMESLIEAAIQGHASTRDAMRWLVRQLVPATQARAQVQGEPSWWMRETDEGVEWTNTAPLVLSGWTPLYTTPQPAQATQPAEVTGERDELLGVVAALGSSLRRLTFAARTSGGAAGADAELMAACDHAEQVITLRGIFDAMRPERVPMTARELELLDGMIAVQLDHAQRCDAISNRDMAEKQKGWDMERVELLRRIRAIGITAQAKKGIV